MRRAQLLRLPTGVFYAQDVKANVLCFDRKPASETASTRELWVYDLRTNQHFTLKQNPLRDEHLRDFVSSFAAREIRAVQAPHVRGAPRPRQGDLDLVWLRDESLEDLENLPPPDVIAQEIVEDLEAALARVSAVARARSALPRGPAVGLEPARAVADVRLQDPPPRRAAREDAPPLALAHDDADEVVLPLPSAKTRFPVWTRTIGGPRPFQVRVTLKRWTPVVVGRSSATPSTMTSARARCSADVWKMHDA